MIYSRQELQKSPSRIVLILRTRLTYVQLSIQIRQTGRQILLAECTLRKVLFGLCANAKPDDRLVIGGPPISESDGLTHRGSSVELT